MKTHIIPIMALAAAIGLGACSSSKNAAPSQTPAKNSPATALSKAAVDSITGDWSVVEVQGSPVELEVLPTVNLSLPDSEVVYPGDVVLCYAFSGCNTINGAFKLTPGHGMTPQGEFISTLMLCPEPNYDQAVQDAVNLVTAYDIETSGTESTLSLYDKGGKKLVTLSKHNIEFLNGAWRVTGIDGEPVAADEGVQMVVDLSEGKLHANGPCNVINGSIEPVMATQSGIRFYNMASTRMTCPSMPLEQKFLSALGNVGKAVKGGKKDTALLQDAKGKTLITMTRMDMNELRAE